MEAKAKWGRDDQTETDTDEDNMSSIAGLSALSSQGKQSHLSVQELGVRGAKRRRDEEINKMRGNAKAERHPKRWIHRYRCKTEKPLGFPH